MERTSTKGKRALRSCRKQYNTSRPIFDRHAIFLSLSLLHTNSSLTEIINEPVVDVNVRSSLMLLKTKARRRRSVAEVEDDGIVTNETLIAHQPEGAIYQEQTSRISVPKKLALPNGVPPSSSFDRSGSVPKQRNVVAATADAVDDAISAEPPKFECSDCGRFFIQGPYERHVKICAKVFMQKRKAFDSAKMRIPDDPEQREIIESMKRTEKSSGSRKGLQKPTKAVASDTRTAKWKNDSERFREAMRAAREVTKALESGRPLPPPVMSAPDSSLIPCPHCNRRFNEKAADRHIPLCQSIKAKPKVLQRGTGVTASNGRKM
jgi:rubrerythrin